MTNPCRCWLTSPPIPHSGHCCLRDDPTPLADIVPGTPPPCGHWVESATAADELEATR